MSAIRRIDFHRTKYGRELLIDAARLSDIANFVFDPAPHALTFHDILLVTAGSGSFALDDANHPVEPGLVFVTLPGEVRSWKAQGLDGACLFFDAEFVAETFHDPRFLQRFAFLRPGRPARALRLSAAERTVFLGRFDDMCAEIAAFRDDAPHRLRALLYEMLVLLNRWWEETYGPADAPDLHPLVTRFLALIEKDFATGRSLTAYATDLAVTPGHLSALCRSVTGRSAGEHIRARVVLEARRRLAYSSETAARIADGLGFADAGYFSRFFRRETGMTPMAYRRAMRRP